MDKYNYDVFLSFRGPDTRNTFTGVLYRSMIGVGIRAFRDDEELRYGKEIGGELLEALDRSRIYIPIFSKGYADSSWCLRELEHMVECMSKSDGKREILPIFFDVDPADVKLKTQLYKEALSRHEEKYGPDQAKRWERALVEVAHTKGWECEGKRYGEVIESIIREVMVKVTDKRAIMPINLVEDHHQINAIIEKLDVGSGGVRFIGIHGMGGIGKTSLAKVVFNKLISHFDYACFLSDVPEHGLVQLQKKIVSCIGCVRDADQIKDIKGGIKWIKRVCSARKVLIVLDNLDNDKQLEKLAGNFNWFGFGSRIIITSRDKNILMNQMKSSSKGVFNQPDGTSDYEVQPMEFDGALQLFYKHAFGGDFPTQDCVAISEAIVKKVDRLPLAVEVIGSHLYRCGSTLKPHFDKNELWKEMLRKLDRGPFGDVRDALMISYDGLKNEQKEVFLDIACFFTGVNKTYPILMWDNCDYDPYEAISILLEQCLIDIGDDNKFKMHDQVRDLGRYIILKEYPHKDHPRQFSRVGIQEDAIRLLKRKEINEDVQALSLTSDGCSRRIAPKEFAALPNLRFLRSTSIRPFGNSKNPVSKLRWLFPRRWQRIFSANTYHFGNLVMLDFSDSDIQDGWRGWSRLKMIDLKVLNLAGCTRLKRTPDLSSFVSLEMLILAECVMLTTIDSSIGKLTSLKVLNMKGCRLLGGLPVEIGSLQSLTNIIMPQNYQPFKIPETIGNLKSLSSLVLDGHPMIVQLPNSVGSLESVTHLSLRGCRGIEKLPSSIGELKLLVKLDLSHSGIIELPDSVGDLRELKVISVSDTYIKKFPHTIRHLTKLEELYVKECQHLTGENMEEIGKLSNLRILDFSSTHVSRFPSVRCLSCLQTLELYSSHIQEMIELPSSLTRLRMQAHHFSSNLDLSGLVNLQSLELHRITATASVEESGPSGADNLTKEELIHPLPSGLSALILWGINRLPPLSNLNKLVDLSIIECQSSSVSVSQDLKHLTKLKLSQCKFLVEITGLSLLENLRYLDMNRLENLVEIHGLSELESLMYFSISHCPRVERLPNLSKLDKLEQIQIEDCPQIRHTEGLEGLESLELDSHNCNVLQILLDRKRWTRLSRIAPEH